MQAMTYIDPDGVTTDLRQVAGVRATATLGLYMPPIEFVEDEVPEQAGSRLRLVRVLPRDVTLQVRLQQATGEDLQALLRTLASRLNPSRGDGQLRVTLDDLSGRELTCRYKSGLEVKQTAADSHRRLQKAAIVLRAFDPFWYDAVPVVRSFTTSTTPFFPLPPLHLSGESINGTTQVENTGDDAAFPRWTITGPCTSVTLTNLTTGESLTLTATLAAGQQAVIDSRRKTVTRDDGLSLYAGLSNDSALWTLGRGLNNVTLTVAGSTSDSYVSLAYALRYLTP